MERIFRGHSMKGTFQTGDVLILTPVSFQKILVGDIIVFNSSYFASCNEVVHRVVRITSDGLFTRGDSARHEDPSPITNNDLIGKVTKKVCGNHILPVSGGLRGQIRGVILSYYWVLIRALIQFAIAPYYALKCSGLARIFCRPRVTFNLIRNPERSFIQLICRNAVVGRIMLDTCTIEIKKPWDLVIREKDLLTTYNVMVRNHRIETI